MARCTVCRISNCETKIKYKGTICPKHRWRMKKFGSYDLPNHIGEPSIYIPLVLPDGIVHDCKRHGHLTINECYVKMYNKITPHYKCKLCIRDSNIRRNFNGMQSMECYNKMNEKQKGLCLICNNPETVKANGPEGTKLLAIDHCHKTGKVRGLLCQSCNAMLGYAKDSPEILIAAIVYLKTHAE